MQPKQISDLQDDIRATHGCESIYRRTELVREAFPGKIAWDGLVSVFELIGHSKAKYCYAWSYREGNETKYTAVLEIPPVDSPQSAVNWGMSPVSQRLKDLTPKEKNTEDVKGGRLIPILRDLFVLRGKFARHSFSQ